MALVIKHSSDARGRFREAVDVVGGVAGFLCVVVVMGGVGFLCVVVVGCVFSRDPSTMGSYRRALSTALAVRFQRLPLCVTRRVKSGVKEE